MTVLEYAVSEIVVIKKQKEVDILNQHLKLLQRPENLGGKTLPKNHNFDKKNKF